MALHSGSHSYKTAQFCIREGRQRRIFQHTTGVQFRPLVIAPQPFQAMQCKRITGIYLTKYLFSAAKVIKITAPRVVLHFLHDSGSNRVAMDITQHTQKISFCCNRLGVIPPAKKRSIPLITPVKIGHIADAHSLHNML